MDCTTLGKDIAGRMRRLFATSPDNLKDTLAKMGLTKSILSEWERGRSSPSIKTLIKFAEYFDVSIDWIIGGDEFAKNQHPLSDETVVFSTLPSNKYSYEEIQLIEKFRSLSPANQGKVSGYIAGLDSNDTAIKL